MIVEVMAEDLVDEVAFAVELDIELSGKQMMRLLVERYPDATASQIREACSRAISRMREEAQRIHFECDVMELQLAWERSRDKGGEA